MENLFWIGFIGAIIAGLFAVTQAKKVMTYSEGTEKMCKIAASIRAGANAIIWTPPTNGELFRDVMKNYREGKPHP